MASSSSPLPSRPKQARAPAPLLCLPIELRQAIYAYLLPRENVSHPLPSVGITSVSHRPPSAALLNIHPTLTAELLDYFYAISTWKIVFSHAFNFFRVDPDLQRLEGSPSVGRLRSVELVFFCDVLLLRDYPLFGMASFCAEIRLRAARACEILRARAPRLRRVTVSWVDTTQAGAWADKAAVLEPLRRLAEPHPPAVGRAPVSFHVGEVHGQDDVDRALFVETLRRVLGPGQRLDAHAAEEEEGQEVESGPLSMQYRMLMRQESHQLTARSGSFPMPTTGRSGWGGAPPWLEPPEEVAELEDEQGFDNEPVLGCA